jgi:Leucine-rich repeat (LRR) protein
LCHGHVDTRVSCNTARYFGPVENFAGLERPFVITTGMQHPLFLIHRVNIEGWSDSEDRVNTRMYLAVTRCTVQLSVVEVRASQFAAHLELSKVMAGASGGVASCESGSMAANTDRDGYDGKIASRVYVGRANTSPVQRFRAGVTVDLDKGTPLDETVVSIAIPRLTRTLWTKNPVSWPSQIREVNLTSALIEDGETGGELLRDTRLLEIANLEVLLLRKNGLVSLPDELGSAKALHSLDLYENKLEVFPTAIVAFTALTSLNLDNNSLRVIPESIRNLKCLKSLALANNRLTSLPDAIGELRSLSGLSIHHNNFETLPDVLCTLDNLGGLLVNGNKKLRELPSAFGNLRALVDLDISGCNLTSLPDSIGECKKLGLLGASLNRITKLPESLCELQDLRDLMVSSNQLTELPADIGHMRALRRIEVGDNRLSELPTSIGDLSELIYLNVKMNNLKCLPPEMGRLAKLRFLELHKNPNLSEIPRELDELKLTWSRVDERIGSPREWPVSRQSSWRQPASSTVRQYQRADQRAEPAAEWHPHWSQRGEKSRPRQVEPRAATLPQSSQPEGVRPRLQLSKRTVADVPAAPAATRSPSIFGAGPPRDESRKSQQSP